MKENEHGYCLMVDREKFNLFKSVCAKKGKTIRVILVELIDEYIKKNQ